MSIHHIKTQTHDIFFWHFKPDKGLQQETEKSVSFIKTENVRSEDKYIGILKQENDISPHCFVLLDDRYWKYLFSFPKQTSGVINRC